MGGSGAGGGAGAGAQGACVADLGLHLWSSQHGDGEPQIIASVAVDDAGFAFVTGSFTGELVFAQETVTSSFDSPEVFVAKLDRDGDGVWMHNLDNTTIDDSQEVFGLSLTAGGDVLVTGAVSGTVSHGATQLVGEPFPQTSIFVARFQADGGWPSWGYTFPSAPAGELGGRGRDVAVDGDGSIVVLAEYAGGGDASCLPDGPVGSQDILVMKLNPSGSCLWSRRYGDSNVAGLQEPMAIAVDSGNNVIAAGAFTGSVDVGGTVLSASGYSSIFLVKLDSQGYPQWAEDFGDNDVQRATDVAIDPRSTNHDIVVTGSYTGATDFGCDVGLSMPIHPNAFVARFDSNGQCLWNKSFAAGTSDDDSEGRAVAIDGAGNVVVTGVFSGVMNAGGAELSSHDDDVFIVKLDPEGNHLWSGAYGKDANVQLVNAVDIERAAGDCNNIVMAGQFQGAVDFGGGELSTEADLDAFLARFAH